MISDGKTNELYKSLGSAYLEVCQQQRDAIIDDDKDRWNLEEKDSYDTVAAVVDYDRSKKGSEDATYDSDHGKKKEAKKERDYAAWERGKMKKDDPNWKHKKYSTSEMQSYSDAYQKIYEEPIQGIKNRVCDEDV